MPRKARSSSDSPPSSPPPSDSEDDVEKGSSKSKKKQPKRSSDDEEGSGSDDGLLKKSKKKKKKGKAGNDSDGSDPEASPKKKSMFGAGKSLSLPKWGSKKKGDADDDGDNENSALLGNGGKKKKKSKKGKKGEHHTSSHQHHLEVITAALKNRLQPAAKDVKGKPLHISEAPLFVASDFGDGTGPSTAQSLGDLMRDVEDDKIVTSKKRVVNVYVESASSGRFFKYAMDLSEAINKSGDGLGGGELLPAEGEYGETREAAMQSLERLLHTGFLVLQGLLAGYSGETVYQAFAPATNENFLS
ncbi:hypothetical protein TeGR_g3647, partial [Tetraparma gracilis]